MCTWSSRRYGSVNSRNASSSPARARSSAWLVTLGSSHGQVLSPHHSNDVRTPQNSPPNFPRRKRLNPRHPTSPSKETQDGKDRGQPEHLTRRRRRGPERRARVQARRLVSTVHGPGLGGVGRARARRGTKRRCATHG